VKALRNTGAGSPARTFVKLGSVAAAFAVAATPLLASGPATASAGAATASAAAAAMAADSAAFYRARGGRPLWLAPQSGPAAQHLLSLLSTAQVDGLNPKRYDVRRIDRALREARSGNPAAVMRAEAVLSDAYVAYARDLRRPSSVPIDYVDPELRPAPPSAQALLNEAAAAQSLAKYVSSMGWMNPFYAQLRQALLQRNYRTETERQLLALNLERARTLPGGRGRYVVVNSAGQRLYMFENGQVVDYMRVVVGKPAQPTPMMAAKIKYTSLNPYWNVPPDLAQERIAPNVVKGGMAYLKSRGYQVLSDWSDNARVIDPKTVNWKAVVAGREQVRLRQLPGPANSMGRMKFMFPNDQGIYLHDTPDKEKLTEAARLFSGGCVRLEAAPRLAAWLYGKPIKASGARPEQKVPLPSETPVYLTYLTALPSGSSVAYFDDIYGLDRAQVGGRRYAGL
jgi:murein L,D-transpeptidase YcbB/YkuD